MKHRSVGVFQFATALREDLAFSELERLLAAAPRRSISRTISSPAGSAPWRLVPIAFLAGAGVAFVAMPTAVTDAAATCDASHAPAGD